MLTALATSNTQNFSPSLGDLTLNAFGRVQIRPTEIQAHHMSDALMMASLLLSEWSVKGGPNLWQIQLQTLPLIAGQASYTLPATTIAIFDYSLRTVALGPAFSLTPNFATTAASTTLTATQSLHSYTPGMWLNFVVPITIGGIVVSGLNQVSTVIDQNNYTIELPASAATTDSPGLVPSFSSTVGSRTVTVTLANHLLALGQGFTIGAAVAVGGLSLSGIYPVVSVVDTSHFTINANAIAASTATVSMNGGQALIAAQDLSQQPQDRVITPISRSEYSAQPNKFTQSIPTTVWFQRTAQPSLTLWPVPDGNGPYLLNYYAMVQAQDAVLAGGLGLDIPYRFLEAFTAGLAAKLAISYPPPPPNSLEKLDAAAERAWKWAAEQDVEDVPLYIMPGLTGYWRQ